MQRYFFLYIFLIFAVLISGCKTKRAIQKSPLFQLKEKALLEQISKNSFDFETMSAKMSVYSTSPNRSGSFKVNMRMAADSIVWMSVSPALGIEAVRITIEPDSINFIDKLKNVYFTGEYNAIDSVLKYSTGFSFMENLLVGNPVEIVPGEKYKTIVDNLYYVLQTKVKRKLKRAVDIQIKPNKKDSVYGDIIKEKKYEKATRKLDEDELITKRYYIRARDFRIARVNIDDLLYKRSIQIEYSDYQQVEGMMLPNSIDIEVTTESETSRFEIDYSRVKINKEQNYPFKIPSKYERM
jgi:hypothetical protein